MIVVDTNILVYLFVQGPKTALAQLLMDREPEWIFPSLWRHEFHNVLSTHVRTKRLTLEQAEDLWRSALSLLGPSEREPDWDSALRLSSEYGVSGYDAQFLALARSRDILCLSEDKTMKARTPKGWVASLEDYLGRHS